MKTIMPLVYHHYGFVATLSRVNVHSYCCIAMNLFLNSYDITSTAVLYSVSNLLNYLNHNRLEELKILLVLVTLRGANMVGKEEGIFSF